MTAVPVRDATFGALRYAPSHRGDLHPVYLFRPKPYTESGAWRRPIRHVQYIPARCVGWVYAGANSPDGLDVWVIPTRRYVTKTRPIRGQTTEYRSRLTAEQPLHSHGRPVMKKDVYTSYTQLAQMRPNDIRITAESRGPICIIAPHGGGIEPGTSEIAREIAGDDCSLYLLEGLLLRGNGDLHVTSTNFDDPRCHGLLDAADRVIAIHGCKDRSAGDLKVYIGGRDFQLRAHVTNSLKEAGFSIENDMMLMGENESNICNRGRSRAGVQLEISLSLRATFFENLKTREGRKNPSKTFMRFCRAVREAVLYPVYATTE